VSAPDIGPALLERGHELEALQNTLRQARAGDGSLVVVEGPAGIGKSTLLAVNGARAQHEGFIVLSVRGDVLVEGSSFAAVRELFWSEAHSLQTRGSDGASRLASPVFEGGDWEEVDRDRAGSVLYGLFWLTVDLADRRPLALVIDDAQWLDAASARFVLYLATRLAGLRVALVVALRSGESERDSRFLAALTQRARTVLSPKSLSRDASDEVVRHVLGARADEDLCRLCHDSTRGNPFYLRELALALGVDGVRPAAELAARARELRVSTITANVLVRLARLGPECGRLSEALQVLGPGSALRQVALLAGLEPDRAQSAADRLYEAELITSGSGLSFVHPIVNEVIAAELPPARRAALHGQAARLLAGENAPVDRVGAHLLLSEPYGDRWVVDLLLRAASGALSQGAPEAAVLFLRRASLEPPPGQMSVQVLRELGRAEALLPAAHDFSALRDALEQARSPGERAEIAYELALALFGVFRNGEAVAVLEDALDGEGLDEVMSERLEAAMIGGGIGDLDESPRLLERAGRHFERALRGEIDDPLMLSSLAQAAAVGGSTADEAASLARRSLADGRLLSQWLNAGYMGAVIGLSFSDRSLEAIATINAGILEAQRRGSAPMLLQFNFFGADAALRVGDLDLAEDFAQRAFELGDELGTEQIARIWLPIVLLHRGRAQEARTMIEAISIPAPTDLLEAWLLANRGLVRIELGEHDAGLADLFEVDRLTGPAKVRPSIDWVPSATFALERLGRVKEAAHLAERELRQAIEFGAPRRHGIALATSGRLNPEPDGTERLMQAADILDRCGARLDHARARIDLGARLHRQGERDAARDALGGALEIADACGARALAERARTELIATGARPRRASRTGPGSLTPAERRVASLAAEGLSNRQIAQSLFLSVKTIEGQLSHAYAKLNVSSRGELRAALSGGSLTRE
jgi:DNA-binding CsgD family transcriptional regulator